MSTAVRTSQALGFTAALFAAGYGFCASHLAVPRLYSLKPSVSTPMFKTVFYDGAVIIVPSALLASAGNAYAAYGSALPEAQRLYIAAALLSIAPLVWTQLVMIKGINRLNGIADSSEVEQEKVQSSEVVGLLKTWSVQNYVRSALYTTGGIIGIFASFAYA
ncbi:DUF1772-domain-containing protein [Rhizodiscina lignyota]|uniref:DUF1772-domain-containing protein n=1 Tax=Rhizodiscina lignyota TaxID=1504668 RepID=A0A9P4I8S5_9PEZI|nr:DUF1772-domain-containing protein [Rhizodiscina lignyota]